MTEATQNSLLAVIVRQWQSLPPDSQPWGVWVRRYPPLPPGTDGVEADAFPEAAWFLDAGGLAERGVWQWRRFWAVQCRQSWCLRAMWPEPNPLFGGRHEIGLASFAPYAGQGTYYLEVIWGGTFGRGWELGVSEAGHVQSSRGLWIS